MSLESEIQAQIRALTYENTKLKEEVDSVRGMLDGYKVPASDSGKVAPRVALIIEGMSRAHNAAVAGENIIRFMCGVVGLKFPPTKETLEEWKATKSGVVKEFSKAREMERRITHNNNNNDGVVDGFGRKQVGDDEKPQS